MFWRKKKTEPRDPAEKYRGEPTYEEFMASPLESGRLTFEVSGAYPLETGLGLSLHMPFGEPEFHAVDAPPRVLSPQGSRSEAKVHKYLTRGLQSMWGVSDPDGLIGTVNHLLSSPGETGYRIYRPHLQKLVNESAGDRAAAAPKIMEEALAELEASGIESPAATQDLQEWVNVLADPASVHVLPNRLPYDVAGWDIVPAAWLRRMGGLVGMLSVNDLLHYSERVLRIARGHAGSWREYVDGFLLGRAHWEESVTDETWEMRDMMQCRLNHPESMWAKYPLHVSNEGEN